MAVVMLMHWPEVSLDQYEQVRADVAWETNTPKGAQFHVAWMGDDGFHVLDLWDSAEDFQKFANTRLMESVLRAGITTQPNVAIAPVHRLFVPGAAPRARAGI